MKAYFEGSDHYASAPSATPQHRLRRVKRATTDLLADLDRQCDRLLLPSSDVPPADRVIYLREAARDLGLTLRDADLQRRIWDARRRAAGAVEMIVPGAPVEAPEALWLWDGLLLAADTNLLVSAPRPAKPLWWLLPLRRGTTGWRAIWAAPSMAHAHLS